MYTPTYVLINIAITALLILIGCILIRWYQIGKIQDGDDRPVETAGEKPVTGDKTCVEAEVMGVTRALRTPGEPEAYQVICKYTDPETGRSETFTSRVLRKYPGKEIIGKMVRVYLDPYHPGKYTVDLDSAK